MLLRRGNPPPPLDPGSCVDGSLPGYCWSTNPSKKGFNLGKIAETFNKLMVALGYTTYVAQGGDWGSVITRRLAQLYPQHCKAIHVNMLLTIGPPRFSQGPLIWLKWVTLIGPALLYQKGEIEALKNIQKLAGAEIGYQVCWGLGEGVDGRLFRGLNRRRWLLDFEIRLLGCWLGLGRSWILGLIIILGLMMN
jgi:pimeloyl-ACP methyl ester carboxylesterase